MKKINLLLLPIVLIALNACTTGNAKTTKVTNPAISAKPAKAKVTKVLFYLQDGVEVLDFAGPMEVFTDAGYEVSVVSKTKAPIMAQGVLTITPKYSIKNAPNADIVCFFGGATDATTSDPEVISWLQHATKADYYFSVCTGAFILGKAGFLDGQKATTFNGAIPALRDRVPKATVLSNVRFVDNGRIITTAGISAGIDGALHMVSKLSGKAKAIEVAKVMEYDKWVPNQGLIVHQSKTK